MPCFAEARPADKVLIDSSVVLSFKEETVSLRFFNPASSCWVPDTSD